jgi:hypothetical protein
VVPLPHDNPKSSKRRKPAKTGRNRRSKANFDVSFDDVLKSLDAAHMETPQFEKTYGANIDPHMCYELHANLRRVYVPDRQEDWDVCNTPVFSTSSRIHTTPMNLLNLLNLRSSAMRV